MQQLNLFFVTPSGGWSRWTPAAGEALLCANEPAHSKAAGAGCLGAGKPDRWCADEILPSLLLAAAPLAGSRPLLRARGVTHIVNVTPMPNCFPEDFDYWQVPIEDDRRAALLPHLDRTLGFVRSALATGTAVVLVHCREGCSRSVAVVLAYLVRHEGLTLDQALELVRRRRPPEARTQPNPGFLQQLLSFEASEGVPSQQSRAECLRRQPPTALQSLPVRYTDILTD
mmetsp:Transcript_4520/g.13307  ORF Transcript_4520/g.13307 Transcript_4520/m.13307 type:complete len:228 (-) Transcript_4520:2-685(-)